MEQYTFTDKQGTFHLNNPEQTSYLYFPIAAENGMMSAVTPELGGDSKTSQNTFLLEPVSSENLHNNRSSRNFWVRLENGTIWSATGRSAMQEALKFDKDKEETSLDAGIMWHRMTRKNAKLGLKAEVTTFAPNGSEQVELTKVTIENISKSYLKLTPIAAIPMYCRSAGDIRDHRNVTSMLHRIFTRDFGVLVNPTLTFDERGHQKNTVVYGVYGKGEGKNPVGYFPVAEDFIGEGGSFENPEAVRVAGTQMVPAGSRVDGFEAMGGLAFEEVTVNPGEKVSYIVALAYGTEADALEASIENYLTEEVFDAELEKTTKEWNDKINVSYESGDPHFDNWMYWVNFQPMLRRIYGCSFLPHHDYGKGGRGWRDLWQDCLALLMMNPDGVHGMLHDNFGGVRSDGTNATIIGNGQGEFIADRNGITRVWMDHGMWPYLTCELYMKQSGDVKFLLEQQNYFKDRQICRGEEMDMEFDLNSKNIQLTADGNVYEGTILEHLLLQHLTAFYDVGEHNHIRLRGADWNDAIDMAKDRGESVAFTTIYGGNLASIAALLMKLKELEGVSEVELMDEMMCLINAPVALYDDIAGKQKLLMDFCHTTGHTLSGKKATISIEELAKVLCQMADWTKEHIRKTEWVTNKEGYSWFNGYYDNSGRRVEGDHENGVRMMLTGQVFSVMSGTASDEQVESIIKAADKYLYDESIGGYRLNTNFHEVKTDMGRMFGFAYGQKENGAVFCHMAVMYANALYQRGFAKEGYKAIHTLYKHASDVTKSRIYPGVPEYIDPKGRGVYHYLTGAGSWLLLTVLTQMYGIRGEWGALKVEPKLLAEQFDKKGEAVAYFEFAKKAMKVCYTNADHKEYGEYKIAEIIVNGQKLDNPETGIIGKEVVKSMLKDGTNEIVVVLK